MPLLMMRLEHWPIDAFAPDALTGRLLIVYGAGHLCLRFSFDSG